MASVIPFTLVIIIALLPQISAGQTATNSPAPATEGPAKFEGTRKMVALLKENAQRFNTKTNPLASELRIPFFRDLAKAVLENEILLCKELLFAGKTDRRFSFDPAGFARRVDGAVRQSAAVAAAQ